MEDDREQKEAEKIFTSILMGQMMKPMAAKMGGLGEMLVNQMVAQFAGVDNAEARLQ